MAHAKSPKQTLAVLQPLLAQLSPACVIKPSDATFKQHSEPFAAQKQLNPSIVLAPDSTVALARVLRFLYQTDLDFVIRNHGFKSPSAEDIIVSLLNFTGFEYDHEKKLATIGVACTWAQAVRHMEKVDPDYSSKCACD